MGGCFSTAAILRCLHRSFHAGTRLRGRLRELWCRNTRVRLTVGRPVTYSAGVARAPGATAARHH
eukprot:360265-Chlamydomonas_euryale.AAC.6